jgi:hypothetical protein
MGQFNGSPCPSGIYSRTVNVNYRSHSLITPQGTRPEREWMGCGGRQNLSPHSFSRGVPQCLLRVRRKNSPHF